MKTLGPLPLKDIRINDPLFGHYIEKLHTEIIPYQWDMLNDRLQSGARSGCLKNFRIAAGLEQGEHIRQRIHQHSVRLKKQCVL